MDNILEKRLLSISQTLKSTSRTSVPRLFNKSLGKIVGGRTRREDSDFADRVTEIYYNITPPNITKKHSRKRELISAREL